MAAGLSAWLGGLADRKGCFDTLLEHFRNASWSWQCDWWGLARALSWLIAGFRMVLPWPAEAFSPLAMTSHRVMSSPVATSVTLRLRVTSGSRVAPGAAAVGTIVPRRRERSE